MSSKAMSLKGRIKIMQRIEDMKKSTEQIFKGRTNIYVKR